MSYIILGFITGMSLILALGPQNIFVIEQGLKKEFMLKEDDRVLIYNFFNKLMSEINSVEKN